MLVNNETDFVATEFMMTSDRLDVLSFTTSIYATKYISKDILRKTRNQAYSTVQSVSDLLILLSHLIY